MTRILLVDNYDSFTYNIWMYLSELPDVECIVVKNDDPLTSISLEEFDGIVISPGPGSPEVPADVGISRTLVTSADLPILGVCLGHQLIGSVHGAKVGSAPRIMHGRASRVRHGGDRLFRGMAEEFTAVRYHSLALSGVEVPLEVIAEDEDGVAMAIRHRERLLWGVQFHPESILSDDGRVLLRNFAEIVADHRPEAPRQAVPVGGVDCIWVCVEGEADGRALHEAFCGTSTESFWLDSSDTGQARFSIMGGLPDARTTTVSYRVRDGRTTVTEPDGSVRHVDADIFTFLKDQQRVVNVYREELLPFEFRPGFVGYFGYELRADTARMEVNRHARLPDARFLLTDRYVVVDHQENRVYLLFASGPGLGEPADALTWFASATRTVERAMAAPSRGGERLPAARPAEVAFRDGKEAYLAKILKCQDYLSSGDSYELCLTNTASISGEFDAAATYSRLRAASPVPYGAFLRTPEFSVLSASPERFMTISGDRTVRVSPIKGTRRRGATADEDEALKRELAGDEKEIAENLMIVDLMRNDLSRVSEIGSVRPVELFAVHTFASVHQLVSTVESRLRQDVAAVDCIRGAFPPGSMTGAPKLRSMEILAALEQEPRGVYSGVLGWVSLDGRADLSVVIRTLVLEEGRASFGVGGAITLLSDPEAEYAETLVKAAAPKSAFGGPA
ncbi:MULTISPECIES: aminodeoxychorismate synthase component I [unclassified Streptomyces]|uniref:aminodeoxychorismate synthase component I n=1 Tax=unclassified Streptomyces TaxID=2593676 RepID=UPI0025B53009|nr:MULTISPECIES: aminodeoxychorismate synthase component I [unclassified Streptomyces]MDN3250087.1 aminodeoxychorismate synthase component I [Streptomyces sp. ZSW22]MDN3257715.1 aminodeoxychorismate synthase component I [Streptomyces sp. MA25(2023)]